MANEQIAIRLPADTLAKLDGLVQRGVFPSRAAAVRTGIEAVIESARRHQIDAAVVEGYQRVPPTAAEDRAAMASLRAAIAEEPW